MAMRRRLKLLSSGGPLILMAAGLAALAQEQKPAASTPPLLPGGNGEASSLIQVLNREMSHPGLQTRDSRYVLHPSDVIEIDFPLAASFNQTQSIQPDGYISLQNIGEVKAAGRTVPQLITALQERYSPIMRDPVITVLLKDFEHPYFVATGEVTKPGKYDLRGTTTVAEAIAVAGGFNNVAKKSDVLLFRRVSADYVTVKKLDVNKMLGKGKLQEDVMLEPGDLLFVPKSKSSTILNVLFPHSSTGLYFPLRP